MLYMEVEKMPETFILNIIYLTFPLTLFIIYNMYSNVYEKEVNKLLSTFLIGTSFYMLIRFGKKEYSFLPLMLIGIPLLISYMQKNKISILILSIITFIYYMSFGYSIYIVFCFILSAYALFVLLKEQKKKEYFIIGFIGFELIMILIGTLLNAPTINWFELFVYFIIKTLCYYLVVVFLENGSKVANIHNTLKDIEHEEQVRLSIFKITHEIKNPIAVCKGYLDMLDPSNIDHSTKYIPIIRSEINRTLCLLQDFLDFNKTKVEKEEMDFSMLLDDLKDSCGPLLKNDKICYFCLNNNDEEIYMQGDYNRLKQVLINMIKNSVEALKGVENPTISVYYQIKKKYLYLTIEDNGVGMSKKELSKIKEPFFTTKGTGTGLGVTISNEVVRAHQGILRYSSKEGKGTKVEIILPLDSN